MSITYVREIVVSYKGQKRKCFSTLSSAKEVSELLLRLLPDNSREHFMALYLNGANQPISYSIVSTGSATSTTAHAREVFQPAILSGAVALIVGHNHPTGRVIPSSADRELTRNLKKAGELLGIKLLDHVIVGDEGYYSFCDEHEL